MSAPRANQLNKHFKLSLGITLVELVIVILLIAILAVMALPRLVENSSVNSYALRDEVIAELRQAQLTAMNNNDLCVQFRVESDYYHTVQYHKNDEDCTKPTGDKNELFHKGVKQSFPFGSWLSVSQNPSQTRFHIEFDSMGRVNNSICPATGNCILVHGGDKLQIAIESEGYIHSGKS